MDHDNSENAAFQMREHGGVNIEVEGNDTMEEDHDDEDHDDQDDDDDDVDAELDVPILDKAHEPLYEGSETTLLVVVLLLVNFKVMNGLSNVAMTCMLRYVIVFHFFSHNSLKMNIG